MKMTHSWKWIAVAAVVLPGLVACSRQETTKENTKMSTELEMKHQIDLGIILDTTKPIELLIPVKNRSERKVTIAKVSKDCSCTAVSIDKTRLLPGETAHVRVSTNLTGKTNFYRGEVIIESDATEKIDEIQINGTITGQIRVRPWQSSIALGDKYAPASFTVFSDDQNGKWKYAGFTSDDPNLRVDLNSQSTSPTTSTYAGIVGIPREEARARYADHQQAIVTLKFVNDKIGKSLDLKHIVDLVTRRSVTTDPPQVTFGNGALEQKRTILVQSGDPINIDSATCNSACVKSTLQRLDAKSLIVELTFHPTGRQGDLPDNLACDLKSSGKTLASILINVVSIP